MKIALVSPYDFAYPGGVINHVLALEHHFTEMGHEVKVIAPASKVESTLGDRFIPIGRPRPIPSSGSIVRITISLRLASTIKAVLEKKNLMLFTSTNLLCPCYAVLYSASLKLPMWEPFMPVMADPVITLAGRLAP